MAIRADRLLKLADYLETVPRERFDMGHWSNGKRGCGFSACAIGWGLHAKMFPGARLIWPEKGSLASLAGPILHYRDETQMGAAALLFGTSEDEAEELFGPLTGGTPKQVAKRIRKFVRDQEKGSKE